MKDSERESYLRFTDLDFFNELPCDLKKTNIHNEIETYLERRNKNDFFNIDSEEFSFDSNESEEDEDDGCGESEESNSEEHSDSYEESRESNTSESYESENDDIMPNFYGHVEKSE